MIRIIILSVGLLFFSFQASANNKKTQWHKVEIGFNLHYPDRVLQQEISLKKISEIGIKHVRIFEIFTGNKGLAYQERLKKALDIILKYKMIPMLSLSNIPPELLPSEPERTILKKNLPNNVARRINTVLLFSNRFPTANIAKYKEKIQEFFDFLFKIYGREQVTHWWFEIGNEPDAPSYYWGTAAQFKKISEAAIVVLKKNGALHIGGYGMTCRAIFDTESTDKRTRSFALILRDMALQAHEDFFYSFHLYERTARKSHAEKLYGLPKFLYSSKNRNLMITEWNVSSQGKKAKKIFKKPLAWGAEFLKLLIDCNKYNIHRIYLFKLMDTDIFSTFQLGAFNSKGIARSWLSEFTAIWNVISDGYTVQQLAHDGVCIYGKRGEKIILAGSKGVSFNATQYRIIFPLSQKHSIREDAISAGKWAVLVSSQQ